MNEYSYHERHMGTDVSLSFVCFNSLVADTMAKQAFSSINDYEKRFSRFIPDSELSKLNTNGRAQVSEEFIEIIKQCFNLHLLTAGNFNPLLQVSSLGYTDSYRFLSDPLHIINTTTTNYNTNLDLCQIDEINKTIILETNQQLDFGGILKGYLAEKIADTVMFAHPTCLGCIINIGGDICTRGLDEFHKPFMFFLYNPIADTETPIPLQDTSLATSGTYARTWQINNEIFNHIIDSKTHKNPTADLVAVSIVAHSGPLSEALTKLFLTRGITEATRIAPPDLHHYKYLTVSNTGRVVTNLI